MGGQEYLIKITKFSTTSVKQAIDYANIIHEMHLRRELIKISESVLNEASNNNETVSSGEEIIQNAEKSLFDLASIAEAISSINESRSNFCPSRRYCFSMATAACDARASISDWASIENGIILPVSSSCAFIN